MKIAPSAVDLCGWGSMRWSMGMGPHAHYGLTPEEINLVEGSTAR